MDAAAARSRSRIQHVGEFPTAPVAQQQAPGVERAGHHGRQQAGAGHEVEAESLEVRDRRRLRGDALAADHPLRPRARVVDDDRRIAARPVQVRLGDLQHERRRRRGVERVAAALQHRHAGLARDPVRAGDDAKCAGDLRAGGEHRVCSRCASGRLRARSARVNDGRRDRRRDAGGGGRAFRLGQGHADQRRPGAAWRAGAFLFRSPRRDPRRRSEGEDHEAIDEKTFATRQNAGAFALAWRAHGLLYGIPAEIGLRLAEGKIVVASVSRTVLAEAASRYPAARGGDHRTTGRAGAPSGRARARRCGRQSPRAWRARSSCPRVMPRDTIMNDGTIEQGGRKLVAILNRLAAAALPA